MGRKPNFRNVACRPVASLFKPAGVPASGLQRVVLPLDCFEAIRLSDLEGLNQDEVAGQLGVSRPTISRILEKGRRILAEALVEGKAIVIEGGPVQPVMPKNWPWRFGRCWPPGAAGGPPFGPAPRGPRGRHGRRGGWRR